MKKTKKVLAAAMAAAMVLGLAACSNNGGSQESETPSADKQYKVGIIQQMEHVALDGAREGFVAALADKGLVEGENLTINYQNGKKIRLQYACDLSSNNKRLISGVDLGTKITDPQNYIVLSADKAKAAVSTWGGSGYGSQLPTTVAARYGKVFNMKTGDVVDNQLLYAVEVQVWFLPMITMGKLSNAVRCEYYPFGELSITESGRSPLMSNYKTWYQTNWYAQGINDGNYSGSQNNSIDIRRYNQNTD